MVAEAIYLLCALTSLVAAFLLWRQYGRRHTPLLRSSGIAFFGLAANNMLVFIDYTVIPTIDLSLLRAVVGVLAMLVLLYGLIWEAGR